MRRSGFSLVELVFSVLLVALVCIGTWMIHTGGWRSMLVTQKKLGAIRGAHLLFERMHRDLKGAHTLLVAPRVPDADTGRPGATVFLIDSNEYVWEPSTGVLLINGERWVLGLFEEISLTQLPRGQVGVRIVGVSDEAAQHGPAGAHGIGKTGRTAVEAAITVDFLRGREAYPFVITENRDAHGYCVGGSPIDY